MRSLHALAGAPPLPPALRTCPGVRCFIALRRARGAPRSGPRRARRRRRRSAQHGVGRRAGGPPVGGGNDRHGARARRRPRGRPQPASCPAHVETEAAPCAAARAHAALSRGRPTARTGPATDDRRPTTPTPPAPAARRRRSRSRAAATASWTRSTTRSSRAGAREPHRGSPHLLRRLPGAARGPGGAARRTAVTRMRGLARGRLCGLLGASMRARPRPCAAAPMRCAGHPQPR